MCASVSLRKASLYERFRPAYVEEAVVELLSRIGPVGVVADVGAGTGQLARLFAPKCDEVSVVEPDSSMRTVANQLLDKYHSIRIVDGSAEQTTLPDSSVDVIVIGDAFHRFRPEACVELHRILREGGWIALFSNPRANSEFEDMLFSRLATVKSLVSRIETAWHRTPTEQLFRDAEVQKLSCPRLMTQDWEAFFGAACSSIEAPEPEEEDFAPFEALNREVFEAFAVDGEIRLDYETSISFGQPKTLE